MTITEALAALKQAWPTTSFSIDLSVWSHVHREKHREPEVEWVLWNADTRQRYAHPTLAGVVQAALHQGSLAEAEASLTDAESV